MLAKCFSIALPPTFTGVPLNIRRNPRQGTYYACFKIFGTCRDVASCSGALVGFCALLCYFGEENRPNRGRNYRTWSILAQVIHNIGELFFREFNNIPGLYYMMVTFDERGLQFTFNTFIGAMLVRGSTHV